ncbi:MAG: hypothetical protein Q9182_002499 [Xanthomendoza sp. 2 TL-2023]
MPPKPVKAKGKAKPPEEKRQESLQAVVLADSYETRFRPFSLERPRCLLPLANTPVIEYTLGFLARAGVEDIFIYCRAHSEQVEAYVDTSRWRLPTSPFKNLVLFKSDAASVGDAMRDLDNRDLITGDFLLVSGDLVSNIAIESALARHRGRREKDKNAIMTMVLCESGIHHRCKTTSRKPVFVINPTTDRCLHYEEIHASGRDGRHVLLDPNLLSEHSEIEARDDLNDCRIDICTPDVLGLWSDNFDYQSLRTGFLFGVLKDYELNGKTIHTHVVTDQYGARVRNLRAYNAISKDMAGRWTYPLCPDSNHVPGQNYNYNRYGIYQENDVTLARTSQVVGRCILGRRTVIGEGVTVSASSLGRNCQIGKCAKIEESYIWDNVVVGNGSTIRQAIVAEGAVIGKDCTIEAGALISYNVRIADSTTVSASKKITRAITAKQTSRDASDISVVGEGGEGYEYVVDSDDGSDASDSSYSMYSNPQASVSDVSVSTLRSEESELEQTEDRSRRASFVSETSDEAVLNKSFHDDASKSILDGLEMDHLPENISLELNAFRMTFNASQHEVRRAVVAAFMKHIANLEKRGTGAREAVHQVFSRYRAVIARIMFDTDSRDKPDQVDFLLSVQRELVSRGNGELLLLFVANEVYDMELVEEDGILQWWLDVRSSQGNMANIRGLMEQFITCLQEAEEGDESEEDEDEE